MAAAIGVRSIFTSADLRRFSRRCDDPDQVRRVLALALILDGGSRSEAAVMAGVTLQIVRDWVLRFNEAGPEGLATRKAPGPPSILNDEQRALLAQQMESGPIPAARGGSLTRAAFLSARNDAFANLAIIAAGFVTAVLWTSAWPDLIVGLGIAAMNADAAREEWTAAREEHRGEIGKPALPAPEPAPRGRGR